MHQYVHNRNFHPAKSDMKAIWNVIRPIVISSVIDREAKITSLNEIAFSEGHK
jgi:hypothetical protein